MLASTFVADAVISDLRNEHVEWMLPLHDQGLK